MSFSKTTILSTRESAAGPRKLAQIVPVPTGRLDKVALFLEAVVASQDTASEITVIVEAFDLDASRLPTGDPLASDSILLSDLVIRGFHNFRLETNAPSLIAIVLSAERADGDNLVSWRYLDTVSTGEEALVSEDGGATWFQDATRKFAFAAYSMIPNVTNEDDQSAKIQPGKLDSIVDDTNAEFSLGDVNGTMVDGDTVVIAFGDFVVTLVVDNSGSMTWNDNDGVRFDFLKKYIDELDLSLPPGSSAKYSIVKFQGRPIGRFRLLLQAGQNLGSNFAGVRILRNASGAPTGPTDGIVLFEGFAEEFLDTGLSAGASNFYAAFSFDSSGNFSEGRLDLATTTATPKPPLGVAGFRLVENILKSGDFDVGGREVSASWSNPAGFTYDKVTLVRRDDRFAISPEDIDPAHADVLLDKVAPATISFLDAGPAGGFVTGLEYFYSIFVENASGTRSFSSNARRNSILISRVKRIWERAEPPFNVPPPGFKTSTPLAPTGVVVTEGNGSLALSWSPGSTDNRVFRLRFLPDAFPQAGNVENGEQSFDGELVFEGTGTSFVHRGLENAQPHFYSLIALDEVGNQSVAVKFVGRPSASSLDVTPPPPVEEFSSEVVDAGSVLLRWKIPDFQEQSVEAFFGDTARAVATVTFADQDARVTSSELSFVEESREFSLLDQAAIVNEESLIRFGEAPNSDAATIVSNLSMTPFVGQLDPIESATIRFFASLRVKDRSSGTLVKEVRTPSATVRFVNPFSLQIINEPPQTVSRRTFSTECSMENSPEFESSSSPGVYVLSGDPFFVVLEAQFAGKPVNDPIELRVRILDDTGAVSDRIKLPETGPDGVAVLETRIEDDEIIDRSGEPNGQTRQRSVVRLSIPPQDVPGQFTMEVSAELNGFTRLVTLPVSFEPVLNIDLDLQSFRPDGVDVAEQKAFVYLAPFDAPQDKKVPVKDGVITRWEISPIGGLPEAQSKSRPFFSRNNVPGTGIKATTTGGIARNIFFGPGTDVECGSTEDCLACGEMWLVTVEAEANGMKGRGFGVIQLSPEIESVNLNRIFLRLAGTQSSQSSGDDLSVITIPADGETEVLMEVLGKPSLDGVTSDRNSGAFFDAGVLAVDGRIPVLEDGRIITMTTALVHGAVNGRSSLRDVILVTNLTPPTGIGGGVAKARVDGGKAEFRLRLNARVTGDKFGAGNAGLLAEAAKPSNLVYGDIGGIPEEVLVISPSVHVVVESDGVPVAYTGGGQDLQNSTPPMFIAFTEPLTT